MHTTKHILVFTALVLHVCFSPAFVHAVESESALSLGYKAYQHGNFEKAVEYLESTPKSDFIILDYAVYYLGEAYLALNRFDEALNAFDACIKHYIESPLAPLALERMGDIYLTQGSIINSLNTYKVFLAEYPDDSQTPDVLYKLISVLLSNNMRDEATPFIKRFLTEYPQHEYSDFFNLRILSEEVKKLDADEFYIRAKTILKIRDYKKAAVEIEGYLFEAPPWLPKTHLSWDNTQLRLLLGQALYHARDYKKAKEVFKKEFSTTGDDKMRQESLMWLARTYVRLKDFKNAKNILKAFLVVYADTAPDNQYREESIYRLAMIAKEEGDINLTTLLLRKLLAEKPLSSYRDDALWQLAWIYYTQRNFEKSLDTLKTLENSPLRMRALYWQGKISLMLGRKSNALKLFKTAADSFPPNYYSAISKKAAEKLGSKPGILPLSSSIGRKQIESNKTNDSLMMKRAQRLLELGLNNLVLKELASMDQRRYPGNLSLLYKEAGDIYHSYIIARNQAHSSPAFDYKLAFPEGYKELVEPTARKFNLDSFLIYAVMMQESEFDARAVSHAGAVGLLQIMPGTGEMIAKKLPHQPFKEDDLFAPPVNINFGAWYLKMLITRFQGNIPLAIAAYNAGPNAVDEWLKRWGKADMDEFIENIPYQETRKYVERVMGYYEVYKTIYNPRLQTYIDNEIAKNDE